MVTIKDFLEEQAGKMGLSLRRDQLIRFDQYYNLLISGNKRFNLTAIEEPQEVVIKHFIDSLLCVTPDLIKGDEEVIDVGSGAGMPGIPLKIFYPHLKLALLETTKKKADFLQSTARALGLTEVDVICSRAETAAHDVRYREHFDFAVSRAVAALPVLLEYCLPFVRPGGYFLALVGPGVDDENKIISEVAQIQEVAQILGGVLCDTRDFTLPCAKGRRKIMIFQKFGAGDAKYPRRPGIPSKRPLLKNLT